MTEIRDAIVHDINEMARTEWYINFSQNRGAQDVSVLGGPMSAIVLRDINIQAGLHQTSCMRSLPGLLSMTGLDLASLTLYQFMLTVAEGYVPIKLTDRHRYLNLELYLPNVPDRLVRPADAEEEIMRRFNLGEYKWASPSAKEVYDATPTLTTAIRLIHLQVTKANLADIQTLRNSRMDIQISGLIAITVQGSLSMQKYQKINKELTDQLHRNFTFPLDDIQALWGDYKAVLTKETVSAQMS